MSGEEVIAGVAGGTKREEDVEMSDKNAAAWENVFMTRNDLEIWNSCYRICSTSRSWFSPQQHMRTGAEMREEGRRRNVLVSA